MPIGPYLYRGTTAGWPGNRTLQEEQITCTTTDPLVATLFAIECRNHGRAIILAANRGLFHGLMAPRNHFFEFESAINLKISPLQFSGIATRSLEVDESLAILREIGFDDVPIRLRDKAALRAELMYSFDADMRLNPEQLELFKLQMRGLHL